MVLPRISSIVNKIGKAFTQLVLDENLDPTLFIIYLLLIIELNVSIHFSRHAGFNLVKMRSRGGMPVAFADFEVSQLLLLIIKHQQTHTHTHLPNTRCQTLKLTLTNNTFIIIGYKINLTCINFSCILNYLLSVTLKQDTHQNNTLFNNFLLDTPVLQSSLLHYSLIFLLI